MSSRSRSSRTRVKAAKPAGAKSLLANKVPLKDRIDIGARFNLRNLTKHAESVLSMVEAHNAEIAASRDGGDGGDGASAQAHSFADYGFDDAWIANMRAQIDDLNSTDEKVQAVAGDAMPTGIALNAAKVAAKEIRRQGVTVVSADPTRSTAMGSLGTGESVPMLRKSLTALTKLVPSYAVTPVGTGAEWIAEAKNALKTLASAESEHTKVVAKLSPAAQQLHAKKGVLHLEIKSVARVARTASPSNAHRFAPSTHAHTHKPSLRRKPKSGDATSPAANPPAAPATATK